LNAERMKEEADDSEDHYKKKPQQNEIHKNSSFHRGPDSASAQKTDAVEYAHPNI